MESVQRRQETRIAICAAQSRASAIRASEMEDGNRASGTTLVNAPSLPRPVGRQREVLYLPASGHTVVLGTAGSGKTTLAILRSLYLADPATEHGGRTLLVTFNRCLVTYMKHLARGIRGQVVVENYHRFARGYLSFRGRMPNDSICTPQARLQFIGRALDDAKAGGSRSTILRRPEEFFDEEFQWIQQHGIANPQSYVDADRIGRAMARVTRAERVNLFALYERYLTQRRQEGKLYDWSDLASAVLRELRSDQTGRRYRHVVIDEGQDFSPEMLRSLAEIIPGNGSLAFFGDIAQQIYGHRVSWRSAGLAARDVWRFRENYRNTSQVAGLALALAAMPRSPTIRTWSSQRLPPPTDRFRSSANSRTIPTNDDLSCHVQWSRHGPERWLSCSGHESRRGTSEDIFREMRHDFTETWRSGRTAPVSSTERITPPRDWNSIPCSCRSSRTQVGRIRPTSGIWVRRKPLRGTPDFSTSGSRERDRTS